MKNNIDVNAYLQEAEAEFSGFYGEDMYSFDDNTEMYFNAEGEDIYSAEGDVAVASPVRRSPSPYQITIVNSTVAPLNAIIFGQGIYLLSANFGSAVGITITPSQANVSYLQLLNQSAAQPFETSLLRIQSTNTAQITQIILITSTDANGQQCSIPLITQSYFSANQFQSGILDIPYNLKVDSNTFLTYSVLGSTTVIMTFFPAEKSNIARMLGGRSALQNYGVPQVPVAAAPVYVAPRMMRPRVSARIGAPIAR
jgi:hypothetical protein